MSKQGFRLKAILLALVLGLAAFPPVYAGSAAIGSVAGSTEATVDGVALQPNTTLFSGDSLRVKRGFAIVAVGKTSRMVFGRDTEASFLREMNQVTVLLRQGNLSLFHPDDGVALRVKAGDVSVTPGAGFKSLGEIAMLDGYLVITSKEGTLLVDQGDQTLKVDKGKPLTITSRLTQAPQGSVAKPSKTFLHINWAGKRIKEVTLGGSVVSAITSGVAIKYASDAIWSANAAYANDLFAEEAAQAAALAASAAASQASSACNGIINILDSLSASFPTPILPSSCGGIAVPAAAAQ
jgi:hypothetical protein